MEFLLHGIDTLQCAYYLQAKAGSGIDFDFLTTEKESLRQSKSREPKAVKLGNLNFLLFPYGSSSGYPFVISNEYFKIEFGEFNVPSFYVTFPSQALWRNSAFILHNKFMEWVESIGFHAYKSESLSRVDFSFDYGLPEIDFDEDCFVTLSSKDNRHREDRKVQTFTFGKGDIVLRIYDKVAEIRQQSDKVWFYILWGRDENVWRIEWQIRKNILRNFDIRTFTDLKNQQGDILRYLSHEHTTLRIPSDDNNRSRFPLHPLWLDLQNRISELDNQGVCRVVGQPTVLEERMVRMAISVYGYLKRVAAINCIQNNKEIITYKEALEYLQRRINKIHDPLIWSIDVQKRITNMKLGQW